MNYKGKTALFENRLPRLPFSDGQLLGPFFAENACFLASLCNSVQIVLGRLGWASIAGTVTAAGSGWQPWRRLEFGICGAALAAVIRPRGGGVQRMAALAAAAQSGTAGGTPA